MRLQVEGRLAGEAVRALESAFEAALATSGEAPAIELAGVAFADPAAAGLLRDCRARGAVLVGCSVFLDRLLADGAAPPPPDGEADLLQRLRAGDGDAYDEVARRYGGRLLATARRMLGNDDDAEDALQEALLSAFRHIGQFNGQARLSTWLHRIVVNAVLMRLRGRRARPETPIEDLLPRFADDGHWADRIAGDVETAEVQLERRQTRARVRQCIDRLPETYRTVVILRDIEELDTDEAAALLGVTANAVKIRLHRARQALRELLTESLAGD